MLDEEIFKRNYNNVEYAIIVFLASNCYGENLL
jgi:hypothetical protein